MELYLDIETQNSFDDPDVSTTKDLKISYIGVIDDAGKSYDFWEHDMDKFHDLLKRADMIIHYNGFSFDMPVIANYIGDDVLNLPQIDLMVAAYKQIGFRPKLDDLSNATLGYGKSGKGTDALVYWAEKDLESLRSYCLQDVQVTKDLYHYGRDHGMIKYYDKSGFLQEVEIDWDLGARVKAKDPGEDIMTLF